MSSSELQHGSEAISTETKWSLIQRILASSQFQRSPRLRELLLYLCRRTIDESAVEIRESEIGVAVFGRHPGFDVTQDTIVRVQASQLRKRIAKYFQEEGTAESLIVEIAKGNYLPVFHERDAVPPAVIEEGRRSFFLHPAVWGSGILILIALAAGAGWAARGRVSPLAVTQPNLKLLWSQLLQPGKPTTIVLADSCLSFLRDLVDQPPVSISAYLDRSYLSELNELPEEQRQIAMDLNRRQYTSIADAELAAAIMRISVPSPTDIALAYSRHFHPRQFHSANVILFGSRYSTPWVELFDQRLNFRILRGGQRRPMVQNQHPRPGEEAAYQATSRTGDAGESYGTISFLPNLDDTGSVLILAGADMEATEAAGRFVTTENLFEQLSRQLNRNGQGKLPYFEAVIRDRKVGGTVREIQLVTYRVIQ